MKKTILSTAILAILSTTSYADNSAVPPSSPNTSSPSAVTAPPSDTTTTPAVPSPETKTLPSTTDQSPKSLDCNFHIPAETTSIDDTTVKVWAENAATQSFDFNPTSIDQELVALKSCYTDQGWQGFNEALDKSGNINAIKSQHLTVSSQVDGELNLAKSKENQWKVTIPLLVVYQNEKEKLTQLLSVDLLIGRKMSGDLGIIQMIASPRTEAINTSLHSSQPTPASVTSGTPTTPTTTATPQPTAPTNTTPTTTTTPTTVPTPTKTVPEGVSPGASTTGTSPGSSSQPQSNQPKTVQ